MIQLKIKWFKMILNTPSRFLFFVNTKMPQIAAFWFTEKNISLPSWDPPSCINQFYDSIMSYTKQNMLTPSASTFTQVS